MNRMTCLLAALACAALGPAAAARQPAPAEAAAYEAQLRDIAQGLTPVTGDVRIPDARAVLHLGEDYYFLPAAQARRILTEAWGNPPQASARVLGMVFPAGRSFDDGSWGAVVTWEATGYVSDDDAETADYDALMRQLQAEEPALNAEARRLGYPAANLVGWAEAPSYDRSAHSLVWARNIRFEGAGENTLNYDVRLLGRRGVLSLNMVTTMPQLAEAREAARGLAAAAEFDAGSRYADYRPGDATAEYGVAGLVAAGVGATVAKKAGLIAVLLAFLKKGFVLVIAGFAALVAGFRRFFGGRDEEEEQVYYEEGGYDGGYEPAGPAFAAAGELPVETDADSGALPPDSREPDRGG